MLVGELAGLVKDSNVAKGESGGMNARTLSRNQSLNLHEKNHEEENLI